MATRRTQGMSPATSLMGAARQFGKVGARGSGNKSVQPGGKSKPVPGLSPGTAPRIQGAVKMPEPMRPAGAAVYPGGLPKMPTGGAQVKPAVGTQPMAGPMAKKGGGAGQPLTQKQQLLVTNATRATKKVYGRKLARTVRKHLTVGIEKEGRQFREPVSKRIAARAIKQTKGAKKARRFRRAYKRNQG